MQIGDMVKNLKSERGMFGIIVDWADNLWPNNTQEENHPVVLWSDGHTTWIQAQYLEVVNANW